MDKLNLEAMSRAELWREYKDRGLEGLKWSEATVSVLREALSAAEEAEAVWESETTGVPLVDLSGNPWDPGLCRGFCSTDAERVIWWDKGQKWYIRGRTEEIGFCPFCGRELAITEV